MEPKVEITTFYIIGLDDMQLHQHKNHTVQGLNMVSMHIMVRVICCHITIHQHNGCDISFHPTFSSRMCHFSLACVNGVKFVPNGRAILTTGADNRLR